MHASIHRPRQMFGAIKKKMEKHKLHTKADNLTNIEMLNEIIIINQLTQYRACVRLLRSAMRCARAVQSI